MITDYVARIRNPQKGLEKLCSRFSEEPDTCAERLAQLGRQEGYEFIREQLIALEGIHYKDRYLASTLTMLRQPEWEWHSSKDPHVALFCLDGTIRGLYLLGKEETGKTTVFDTPREPSTDELGGSIADPRLLYVPWSVKTRVWLIRRKYWVVRCGRIIDLIKSGFAEDKIRPTQKDNNNPAFVMSAGPFNKAATARRHK